MLTKYNELVKQGREAGDSAFCGPLALAAHTGMGMDKARELLKIIEDRKNGEGTSMVGLREAYEVSGYELIFMKNWWLCFKTIRIFVMFLLS